MADDYTPDDFRDALGETYDVESGGETVGLVLDDFQDLPAGIREHGCFKLRFLGPGDPLLPQGLYPFRRDGRTYDIFIVPIGQSEKSSTYEAIFN